MYKNNYNNLRQNIAKEKHYCTNTDLKHQLQKIPRKDVRS